MLKKDFSLFFLNNFLKKASNIVKIMDNGKQEAEFPPDPSKFLLSISVFMALKKSANVPPHF